MPGPVRFVLTTNSPGEVSGWLTPVVAALRERYPAAAIHVFLPPCDFASGAEAEVVRSIAGIDGVWRPREYLRFALAGLGPPGLPRRGAGAVIFLGGDLIHAVLLSRRLGLPAFAYTEGFARWSGSFRRFFLPDRLAREKAIRRYGAPAAKLEIVGNLMVDAVHRALAAATAAALPPGLAEGNFVVLLPGSRPPEFRQVFGLFLRAAARLALPAVVLLSPFISWRVAEEVLKASRGRPDRFLYPVGGVLGPAPAELALPAETGSESRLLVTDDGRVLPVYRAPAAIRYQLMARARAALCLPGTNTLEMATLGLPAVVALPLQRPDLIPLPGLAGILGRLPGAGRFIRKAVVEREAARRQWLALPNLIFNGPLLPEVRGRVTPQTLADALEKLLAEEPGWRRARLREVAGPAGAAARLVEAIARELQL
ncbi:MAG: hypothetical protein IMX00_10195 [Limnochordales bacterium]|nr:hypothetical protein [Limnochordales bacterium]